MTLQLAQLEEAIGTLRAHGAEPTHWHMSAQTYADEVQPLATSVTAGYRPHPLSAKDSALYGMPIIITPGYPPHRVDLYTDPQSECSACDWMRSQATVVR